MTWPEPTTEQLSQAYANGQSYAGDEISGGNQLEQEAPLSGEWAGAPVPRTVAADVGYFDTWMRYDEYAEGETAIADAWENGYTAAWNQHHEDS